MPRVLDGTVWILAKIILTVIKDVIGAFEILEGFQAEFLAFEIRCTLIDFYAIPIGAFQ